MIYARTVLLLLVLTAGLEAQPTTASANGRGRTLDEALQSHKIELTQSALVDALKNADPEVRYLAALKLAEEKKTDTISAIIDALTSEKVAITRVNIAFALAQFGDATGFSALGDGCSRGQSDPQTSLLSAQYLVDLHRGGVACLNALLDIAQLDIAQSETASNGDRMQAASILPKFQGLSSEDAQRVFESLLKALDASDASVKMAASQALADLGNGSAIPALERAIANEHDEVVRWQLERDLLRLQPKKQP